MPSLQLFHHFDFYAIMVYRIWKFLWAKTKSISQLIEGDIVINMNCLKKKKNSSKLHYGFHCTHSTVTVNARKHIVSYINYIILQLEITFSIANYYSQRGIIMSSIDHRPPRLTNILFKVSYGIITIYTYELNRHLHNAFVVCYFLY